MLCLKCQYCGDKFSFPIPNAMIYVDKKEPFKKHNYC